MLVHPTTSWQLEFMRPRERLELHISGQKEHKAFIQAGEA